MSKESSLLIILGVGGGLLYWFTRKKPVPPVGGSNIVSTAFSAPTIPVGTYNTVAVDITWTNLGEVSGSFSPQIQINGVTKDLGEGIISLTSGAVHRSIKVLTGITAGSQNICPVPS